MKNIFFSLGLLCTSSLCAQFSYNSNNSGIQSPTNIASGFYATAMGYQTEASGDASTATGDQTTASGYSSTATG